MEDWLQATNEQLADAAGEAMKQHQCFALL
jgi:hypothetical protein